MSSLLLELPDPWLQSAFDQGALQRGRRYAEQGRVRSLDVAETDESVLELEALVTGSGGDYAVGVLVERESRRWLVSGDCACPVGINCKHAVATILAARDSTRTEPAVDPDGAGTSAWERTLDSLLAGLEGADDGREATPLALQVGLHRPGSTTGRGWWGPTGAGQPVVQIRPLQGGRRENWIKTGATWHDVPALSRSREHDPRQTLVLSELAGLWGTAGYDAGRTNDGVRLGDFGPGVWPLLRQAVDAGITLVAGENVTELEVADSAATIELDAVAGSEDADTRLVPTVRVGEEHWASERLVVLGSRGHGVALLTPEPRGRHQDSVRMLLAPLQRTVTPGVRRLLEATEPLRLPAGDDDRLVAEYLPRLQRHLPVSSSDGSITLPEEVPPRLVLAVAWGTPGRAGVSWHWRYQLGSRAEDVPADGEAGRHSHRRPEQERDHLDRLRLDACSRDLLSLPEGTLRTRQELRGDDVLRLVAQALPALHENPLVEVEETGEVPDYREAEGEPEIGFELAGPEVEDDPDQGTDWLDLQVVLTIDGESVPLPLVLEALTRGDPWIFLPSGLYLPADHPDLVRLAEAVRAAAELHERERQPDDQLRVSTSDLATWGELDDLGSVDGRAERWVSAARALAGFTGLPEVEPEGVTSDLRSYQRDGFRWLAFLWQSGLGGVLGDDMGLGKTLQALALVSHARSRGAEPFLVVAPTSVVAAWQHEAACHAPGLDVRAITGTGRRRGTTVAEEVDGADVVVTSYTLLRLEAEEYAALGWGGLVLDEAQQVKNHQSKTYRAVRALDAGVTLTLTGTPFENRLMELWSLLSLVAPGLYPVREAFTRTVVTPVEKQGDQQALDRFRRRIRPFLLRRTKELVADDLPPKQEQVLDVTLSTPHRQVYDTHLQHERQSVLGLLDDFDENRIAIFRALTRLRQLSLDPALVDPAHDRLGSAKLDVLVAHLHELVREGHRALVFSQFTGYLARVRDRLAAEGLDFTYLDGSTRDRGDVVQQFREGTTPVFLISLKAGGVGLTLTEADYVFVLDPWWNPAVEAQAVDRTHRIGQNRPVMVYRLVATDTIEEKVMALKERKGALFDQVLDGDGAMAQPISAADVRELLGA